MIDFYRPQNDVPIADALAHLSERFQQVRAQLELQQDIDDQQQQHLNQQSSQIEALTGVLDKVETQQNADEFVQHNGAITCLI